MTEKREQLIQDSRVLVERADDALRDPRNVAKGDHFEDIPTDRLLLKLDEEVQEFKEKYVELLHAEPRDQTLLDLDSELLNEGGDVINILRIMCFDGGAIPFDAPPEVIPQNKPGEPGEERADLSQVVVGYHDRDKRRIQLVAREASQLYAAIMRHLADCLPKWDYHHVTRYGVGMVAAELVFPTHSHYDQALDTLLMSRPDRPLS